MILELSDAAAPRRVEVSARVARRLNDGAFAVRRRMIAITIRLGLVPALLSAIEELSAQPGPRYG